MRIMTFKSWMNTQNESVKENELNRILDKLSKNIQLTDVEQKFLDVYNTTSENHYKDNLCITKNDAYNRIKELLDSEDKIICNLYDRDGKIELPIIRIENDFEEDSCYIIVSNGDKVMLYDRYLYNIIYNLELDEYSLETEDEFFEPILVKNED